MGKKADTEQAKQFFKTGSAPYGKGDVLLGICGPVLRKRTKERIDTLLDDTVELLQSPFHEARRTALFIMVYQAKRGESSLPV